MRAARLLFAAILLLPLVVQGADFKLAFPVDCSLGQDCVIQNYVDVDPGAGWRDYQCGFLSYDGHKGTDIRIRDYRAMAKGVAVLAAADGVVLGTRNDMDDRGPDTTYDAYLKKHSGKECGNGVVLDHGEGFQTQYCHLMKASVAVETGDRVGQGDVIGAIGLSGKTQFPHLHISVRQGKKVVDPFTGVCGDTGTTLWKDAIGYTGTQLLKFGFTDGPQTLESIERGVAPHTGADSPALVFWANVIGIREGDMQEVIIRKPDGSLLASNSQTIEKSKVNWLSYIGKKRPHGGWPKGIYTAVYSLEREGVPIIAHETSLRIN